MRLIDADPIAKYFTDLATEKDNEFGDTSRMITVNISHIIQIIDNAPTIEPKMLDDGTLVVKVEDGGKVGRVLVEWGEHFCGLYYADAEPKQGEWIPCSERLPSEDEDVMAWVESGDEARIACCNYAKEVWFDAIMDVIVSPIAWMPLPEPWEGAGE